MATAARKLHDADIADRAAIETATEFTAFVRLGADSKIVEPFGALAAACARAAELRAEHAGRDVLVYAITPDGVSIPVPKDMQGIDAAAEPAEALTGKTWDMKRSAQKAAHRAGLKHTDYDLIEAEGKFSISVRGKATEVAPLTAEDHATIKDAAKKVGAEIRTRRATEAEAIAYLNKLAEEPTTLPIGHADKRRAAVELVSAQAAAEVKPAAEPKPAKAPKVTARGAVIEAAQRGELPTAPDFSAETHKRFRAKLAQIVALIEAGDIDGLKAIDIKTISSSPKAMDKFRNLAVIALEARIQKQAA